MSIMDIPIKGTISTTIADDIVYWGIDLFDKAPGGVVVVLIVGKEKSAAVRGINRKHFATKAS